MTTRLIVPAAALAVSMAEAKESLRIEVDNDSLDASIIRWVKGITAAAEHATGRAFIHQQWRETLDTFPFLQSGSAGPIELAHAPTATVERVRFMDVDGVWQTLHPQDYIVDVISEPGYIVPASDKAWPETKDQINAVMIDYTAGYGPTDADVPETVKLYILARLVGQMDPATRMERDSVQSEFTDRLLDAVRVYR
jgi:uncharacterized phiE125 gp8 family phage protein